jgi:pimeloyl-ACP methyl ester carboxylesterase
MTYASVNGQELYYEIRGSGRPLVLLHGGVLTIELAFGPLLEPLAATRQVIGVELAGHGRTALADHPPTMEGLASDVLGLLDHLGIAQADLFGYSLGALVSYAVARAAPGRVGRMIAASADPLRPPGRESRPIPQDLLPTMEEFQSWREAYAAVAPDPARFDEMAARTTALVHEMPAWTADELRALRTPALLIFGDRDFNPLPDVAELFGLLPDAQLAVLPGTTHVGVSQRPDAVLALIGPFLDAG